MKYYLLLILIILIPLFSQAQNSDSTGKFGFVINSSLNGEIYPIRLVPSVTYYKEIINLNSVSDFIRLFKKTKEY